MIRYKNSNDLRRAIEEGELGEGGICLFDENKDSNKNAKHFLDGFSYGEINAYETLIRFLGLFQSKMKVLDEDTAQIRISDWEELKQQLQKEIGGKREWVI